MTTKSSRRNIVRDVDGDRYLLTSRRIVQMDSADAKEGTPWYAYNAEIKRVTADGIEGFNLINVSSRVSTDSNATIRVQVRFGKTSDEAKGLHIGTYQIGCGHFTRKTFLRILKNAGVQTTKKAFAAVAGL